METFFQIECKGSDIIFLKKAYAPVFLRRIKGNFQQVRLPVEN